MVQKFAYWLGATEYNCKLLTGQGNNIIHAACGKVRKLKPQKRVPKQFHTILHQQNFPILQQYFLRPRADNIYSCSCIRCKAAIKTTGDCCMPVFVHLSFSHWFQGKSKLEGRDCTPVP